MSGINMDLLDESPVLTAKHFAPPATATPKAFFIAGLKETLVFLGSRLQAATGEAQPDGHAGQLFDQYKEQYEKLPEYFAGLDAPEEVWLMLCNFIMGVGLAAQQQMERAQEQDQLMDLLGQVLMQGEKDETPPTAH